MKQVDVLALGGGYSGLWGAINAADVASEAGVDLSILLVSRDEYLSHRPRLYECNPDSLRVEIQPLVDPVGVEFMKGEVTSIDEKTQVVTVVVDGESTQIGYRRLILATGSSLVNLPIPGTAEHAFNVDSYDGAKKLDQHLIALKGRMSEAVNQTFVVVGAGMTGIEIATEMRTRIAQHHGEEIAARARVILVEKASEIGPLFGDSPRPVIEKALAHTGVEVWLETEVTDITPSSASFSNNKSVETATVIITVGMKASDLTKQISGKRDDLGRLHVDEVLRVEGAPEIFASGDVAHAFVDDGNVALMSCQNSRTMGKYVGRNAAADLIPGVDFTVYRQADYTTCLDLGTFGAVYTEGFERELKYYGAEAKLRKIMINREMIYPPAPLSRQHIVEKMRIDHRGR
ncbi:NAD(P)/FAD-dependent oxidoreductase [Ruegeria atlantica]|uniref:NAD(P)/FAD-dependent oxidoreductase n=1 Tax=Ruegeria atlantica TaxID=81569 RepID=UPI00147CC27C|nr:FAD-dependent oxidoreductase [Ruegeria atlantica]